MLREPLPSELLSERRGIPSLSEEEMHLLMGGHDHDALPDACERIRELCQTIVRLNEEQRQKVWRLLKMPFAPLTALSSLAAIAALLKMIPGIVAGGVSIGSVSYSTMKGMHCIAEYSADSAEREAAIARIKSLLSDVCERDILIVRALLDEVPSIRERCSGW